MQCALFIALSFPAIVGANDELKPRAVLSIIIDDIGYRKKESKEAINLPAALTFAVLPDAPHTAMLASFAHAQGKEVMLHMPMQSTSKQPQETRILLMGMSEKRMAQLIQQAFAKVPYAVGMNNHQGSLLTRHPGDMAWVMAEMKRTGRYFVDSRTSKQSVAEKIAKEFQVPVLSRDVFLDDDKDEQSIEREFKRLVQRALKNGYAVGIGHPNPETIAVLRRELPTLKQLGIDVVPISTQLEARNALLPKLAHSSWADKKH